MPLTLESYVTQASRLPQTGNFITAQYDENYIVIYQAYPPSLALYLLEKGHFGGEYNFNRMTWIKASFLWMMHRSKWATAIGQEIVLALWLERDFFDRILGLGVPTSFTSELYMSHLEWKTAIGNTDVVYQWDPDYDACGRRVKRRAIQIGLRGEALELYANGKFIANVENITSFVQHQRQYIQQTDCLQLMTPRETVYLPSDHDVVKKLQLSSYSF